MTPTPKAQAEATRDFMRVIQITNSAGCGSYILNDESLPNLLTEVSELLQGGEVGDSLTFTLSEMPEKEFKALPEFEGW